MRIEDLSSGAIFNFVVYDRVLPRPSEQLVGCGIVLGKVDCNNIRCSSVDTRIGWLGRDGRLYVAWPLLDTESL